jgi:hypothetical protein
VLLEKSAREMIDPRSGLGRLLAIPDAEAYIGLLLSAADGADGTTLKNLSEQRPAAQRGPHAPARRPSRASASGGTMTRTVTCRFACPRGDGAGDRAEHVGGDPGADLRDDAAGVAMVGRGEALRYRCGSPNASNYQSPGPRRASWSVSKVPAASDSTQRQACHPRSRGPQTAAPPPDDPSYVLLDPGDDLVERAGGGVRIGRQRREEADWGGARHIGASDAGQLAAEARHVGREGDGTGLA